VLNESKPDVIIDFAAKQSILRYLEPTVRQGANLVVCSTGYDEIQLEKFKRHTERIGIVWAPNVTDGINILSSLSKLVKSSWPDADISVIETHHSAKEDISGTALKLTEDLRDTEHIKIGRAKDSPRVENEIVIHKVRLGGVIGKHQFVFGDPYQTITLTHETISRRAFGSGAIRAARWIHKKKGFYSMDHVIGLE
jgi:4-hydroxy-tetrahydrodipicolinate reductase